MEGVLVTTVKLLRRLDDQQLVQVIKSESNRMELTKSLLNLLFNICFTKAIPLSRRLQNKFKVYDKLVIQLLTGARSQTNRTPNLKDKQRLLRQNPDLVRLIAEACPQQTTPSYVQTQDPTAAAEDQEK